LTRNPDFTPAVVNVQATVNPLGLPCTEGAMVSLHAVEIAPAGAATTTEPDTNKTATNPYEIAASQHGRPLVTCEPVGSASACDNSLFTQRAVLSGMTQPVH
jgi:hypothetical protein